MKKVILAAVLAMFAAVVFAGCNAEELKKLNDQVAQLTAENQTLKSKAADLDKAKGDLTSQLSAANAALDGAKKIGDESKAALDAAIKICGKKCAPKPAPKPVVKPAPVVKHPVKK